MSKKRELMNKTLAGLMAASMAVGLCPVTAFAVTGDQVAKDGVYEKTVHVINNPDDENDWTEYNVKVSLEVSDGTFTKIAVSPDSSYDKENDSYFNKATVKSKGIETLLTGKDATEETIKAWDTVSNATCTSKAVKEAALEAIHDAEEASAVTIDTASLDASIKAAKALSAEKYTAESWSSLQQALTEAEAVLEAKASQEDVTKAEETLNIAIKNLVKAEQDEKMTYYVMMNIPYGVFYDREISNDDDVDAVASATKNKSKRFPNTYYTSAGDEIKGIKMPVKMDAATYDSLKNQVSDEAADYYMGEVLSETPAVYKELTYSNGVYSVGAATGKASESTDADTALSTDTPWGDYLIKMSEAQSPENVYGAYLTTTDGKSFGLRHLENIWSMGSYGQIAWSSGIKTTEPHGNTLNPEHYKDLMGKTVASVTWICADGIKTVKFGESGLYIPYKDAITVSVEPAAVTAGKTKLSFSEPLPSDFAAEYAVEGLQKVKVENDTLTYDTAAAMAGSYTLTVSDANKKYADKTAAVVLSTDVIPAIFNNDAKAPALVKAADVSDVEFKNFIKNITSVNVNGKDYNASGKRSVVIVKEDGSIDTTTAPFAKGDTFDITVTASGYDPVTFVYKAVVDDQKIDTSALEAALTKAESLKESDYTSSSWKMFASTLSEAKAALKAQESQESVDNAAKALQAAIKGLVTASADPVNDNKDDKKPTDNNKNDNKKDDTTTNKNNNTSSNKNNSTTKTSPKTGDPVNVLGLLAVAASSVGLGGVGLKLRKKSKKK